MGFYNINFGLYSSNNNEIGKIILECNKAIIYE